MAKFEIGQRVQWVERIYAQSNTSNHRTVAAEDKTFGVVIYCGEEVVAVWSHTRGRVLFLSVKDTFWIHPETESQEGEPGETYVNPDRSVEDEYCFEASCSGLRYRSPEACGEVAAVWVGGKRYPVAVGLAPSKEHLALKTYRKLYKELYCAVWQCPREEFKEGELDHREVVAEANHQARKVHQQADELVRMKRYWQGEDQQLKRKVTKILGLCDGTASWENILVVLEARITFGDGLKKAIQEHHDQKADDLCWMDDNKLYEAAGLSPRDNRVGDPEAMLMNCRRFIATRCSGGNWKSYAELEKELEELKVKYNKGVGEALPVKPANSQTDSK